jgi:hypothetical protein
MSVEPSLSASLIVFALVIISFAIFEGLVKVVFVQLKRFEAKYDTTYYGAIFGIIIGASITMGRTYEFFVRDLTSFEIAGIFLFALAVIFMNGAAGGWLGYGVHKRDLRWSFISVVLISLPFNTLVFIWYLFNYLNREYANIEPGIGDVNIILIAAIYGIAAFLYVYYRILPEALPLKYQRERLREARKQYKQ